MAYQKNSIEHTHTQKAAMEEQMGEKDDIHKINSKVADFKTTLPITALNANTQVKRQTLTEQIFFNNPTICCLQDTLFIVKRHFQIQRHYQIKSKRIIYP